VARERGQCGRSMTPRNTPDASRFSRSPASKPTCNGGRSRRNSSTVQIAPKAPGPHSGAPGVALEKIVATLQQMLDPDSTVTHNEWLTDRLGHRRQCDVVVRGQFGGRPMLGIVECKDHSRKKGPDAVEAFAKKADHLGANLRLMVWRKGFTEQALSLAKHEGIGCLSLLPEDPAQCGFSIGEMWYGIIRIWTDVRLTIHFASPTAPIATFDGEHVKYAGKPVMLWFLRELFTTDSDKEPGDFALQVVFDETRDLEVAGRDYSALGLTCNAVALSK
jgi:hypothetical protein